MVNSPKKIPLEAEEPQPEKNSHTTEKQSFWDQIGFFMKPKNSGPEELREALEEYIEEISDAGNQDIATHEKKLITNVLHLRDRTVVDVMIPRADIIAIDVETSQQDLLELLSDKQYSRLPVYKDTLDDVIGTIHIKDILSQLAMGKEINLRDLIRDVPIVSPSLPVLDLILQMRQNKKHMAMVVDEYGGIDGLVTVGDVVESIVGELEDEFDQYEQPDLQEKPDGSILADARFDIDDLESRYGEFLLEDERDDIDTLGGLVFSIAGRIPARGEVLKHEPSGLVFEIIDADPRRINRIRIKNISQIKSRS